MPAEKSVLIYVELNARDLSLAGKAHQKIVSALGLSRWREWFTLVVLLFAILFLCNWIEGPQLIVPALIIELLTVAAVMSAVRSQTLDEWKQSWAGVFEFEFFDGHLRYLRKTVETKIPWPRFAGFSQTSVHLFLWIPNGAPLILPKAAFKSPEDLKWVEGLLRERLKILDV